MKNKLLLVLTLVLCVFVSACSCNKFDINTYTSAVKNYKNSVGVDYNLVVTTTTSGSNKIVFTESTNTYEFEFDTTKYVNNFSSTTKTYEMITSNVSANGDPEKVYEFSRYYVGNTGKFHTIINSINGKETEDKSYEQKYDTSSEYHLDNIIPVFEEKDISDFNIEEDKSNKGHSIATFKAACPAYLTCSEKIEYKVSIDNDYYFTKIEYAIVNDAKTTTYEYTFNKFNNDVKVTFPNNLA